MTLDDKDLQKYYDDQFAMHASNAWKEWQRDVEAYRQKVADIDYVDTAHSLDFRRGQKDILTWLARQEEVMRLSYDELLQQQKDAEEDAE